MTGHLDQFQGLKKGTPLRRKLSTKPNEGIQNQVQRDISNSSNFSAIFPKYETWGRRGSQEKVSSKHRFLFLLNIQFITSKATRWFSKVILSNVLIVFFDQVSSFVNSYLDFSTCKSLLTNSNKKMLVETC